MHVYMNACIDSLEKQMGDVNLFIIMSLPSYFSKPMLTKLIHCTYNHYSLSLYSYISAVYNCSSTVIVVDCASYNYSQFMHAPFTDQ